MTRAGVVSEVPGVTFATVDLPKVPVEISLEALQSFSADEALTKFGLPLSPDVTAASPSSDALLVEDDGDPEPPSYESLAWARRYGHLYSPQSHDCDTSRRYPIRRKPPVPWKVRGQFPAALNHDDNEKRYKVIQSHSRLWKRINPLEEMAKFYLLQFMLYEDPSLSRVTSAFPEDLTAWRAVKDLAQAELDKQCEDVAPLVALYADIAIGGELRHHPQVGSSAGVFSGGRETAWKDWLVYREQIGIRLIRDAAQMFRDKQMPHGYGDEAWAQVADVLFAYRSGEMPGWLFLDRVFTLQHNGGSLFNKAEWKGLEQLRVSGPTSLEMFKFVGAAHADESPMLDVLMVIAPRKVRALFGQWWVARNRMLRSVGEPMVKFPQPEYSASNDPRICWNIPRNLYPLTPYRHFVLRAAPVYPRLVAGKEYEKDTEYPELTGIGGYLGCEASGCTLPYDHAHPQHLWIDHSTGHVLLADPVQESEKEELLSWPWNR